MTSRERMLAALSCRPTDHLPCAFMIFGALRQKSSSPEDFVERQLALGVDAFVQIPPRPASTSRKGHDSYDLYGLPVRFHPETVVTDRVDRSVRPAVVTREYRVPAGKLTTSVELTEDWPHGERVPIFDDYVIPRARKRLVTCSADLPVLRQLLAPPRADDLKSFRESAGRMQAFAKSKDLLTVGEWGVLFDAANWLCGMEELSTAAIEDPGFVEELLDILGRWNLAREAVLLEQRVDLLTRRAWYEITDFLGPDRYARFILPWLKREAAQAHQAGAKLGCISTSAYTPLLPRYLESGMDCLLGVDPVQDARADFPLLKKTLGGRVCVWGGVNGFVTIEQGTPAAVREAVQSAARTLAPGGGFILSPVDNVREDTPVSRANVEAFVAAWKEIR